MEAHNAPVEVAENENVVKFAEVDGATTVFTTMPETEDVRAQLDDLFATVGKEFVDALLPFMVDVEIGEDYDMMYVYE